MTSKFPPILDLGGAEAFAEYTAEFRRLYRSGIVEDVWGRVVRFELPGDEDCKHVCTSGQPGDKRQLLPREWNQERAERLHWITIALREPESIRPSHKPGMEDHEGYLVAGYAERASGAEWERYVVYVAPEGRQRGKHAKSVVFVTAYPIGESYWDEAIQVGPRYYPEKRRR
jgi:hypothetical protein